VGQHGKLGDPRGARGEDHVGSLGDLPLGELFSEQARVPRFVLYPEVQQVAKAHQESVPGIAPHARGIHVDDRLHVRQVAALLQELVYLFLVLDKDETRLDAGDRRCKLT